MPLDITIQLRQFVIERAAYRCEYCLMPQTMAFHEHEPDHIIPRQHGGETEGGIKPGSARLILDYQGFFRSQTLTNLPGWS